MENKGCITCRKCEQVRINFYCGRKKLSQKQLYNTHGFCSNYEPKEQIEKPMTNEEWLRSCNTEQLAEWIADKINDTVYSMSIDAWAGDVDRDEYWQRKSEWVEWLKQPHEE